VETVGDKLKRVNWITILEVVYILALLWLLLGRNSAPVTMRVWRSLMILSQRVAYTTGQAGLYAEKAYWAAVERARS
jgi:hypothetical protein